MPARSKKQQMAAGAALSAKRKKKSPSSLKGSSRSMYESMSEKQLREIAKTKRNKLPSRKSGGTSKNSRRKPPSKPAQRSKK